ncbi:hypothetical protein VF14_35855 [Nostoc linckia z18]|uniref:Uncharacterized protein n=2 Tax=Nostoc linckia TaxID=92942 RepID=A0A9Q6EHA8_NOSLI|nr:hypothetical protein [Nostoc linckia]PHK39325.1 hypothetical protein VF13_34625 [Nostoc linckia z16]PHJ57848.1 hypothetical protein VF02_29100 [Nostoc linckia z1]PHJ60498.1 hypothetical protein VF05_30310 [Nostoc linckia z3]PHJ62097.1 hypothetical protein VF03_31495 [Nostoc linckia z2]PHJ75302.1 hypothetical protein VF06_33370 [Nostoc linckia z4]
MDKESENRLKHFAALKSKYQASNYQDSSPSSLLYLILRKVDLGIQLSDLEFNWLGETKLEDTLEAIKQEQQHKVQEFGNLEFEFSKLKPKYKATNYNVSWESSHLYFILLKLESGNLLSDSEIKWLRANNLYETNKIAQEIKLFAQLKLKYKATQYQDSYPDNKLFKILKKLESTERLNDSEYNWLIDNKLLEVAEIFKQQESVKEAHFFNLKDKYQANQHSDLSLSSPLYSILQKIDAGLDLIQSQIHWLEQQGLNQTITIARELQQKREFAALKVKYKATDYQDSSPKSHLYKILKKIELSNELGEQDINFLQKRKLNVIIEIVNQKYASTLKYKVDLGEVLNESEIQWLKKNKREDIIIFAQQKHFAILKRKYGLIDPALTIEPFYTIMVKLEKQERLDPILVAQLIDENLLSRDGKIAIGHYKLEAEFYEQEIQRTGNKWHIPSASSYWRKANEPEQALKITNLDLGRIKESNLKSAILVTRGAAFRDMDNLADAENCAIKAMKYQSNSYQPYTLMGAICYDRGNYVKGDYWFEQAIQRGAKTEDIDDELKRVFRSTKNENKRHEAAEYLLKKDSKRYSWAKSYLKKPLENHK